MDKVFETWLQRQHADALALGAASDVVSLAAETGPSPPRRFIAHFDSPTMVRHDAEAMRANGFVVLFQFPPDYLRVVSDPAQVISLIGPRTLFHPNVAPPFICIGAMPPGTGLCELIYQVHEILTFHKFTPREDNALNRDACAWARHHMHLFPLSSAPLRRRDADFSIDDSAALEPSHGTHHA